MPKFTKTNQASIPNMSPKDVHSFTRIFYVVLIIGLQFLFTPFPPLCDWVKTFTWQPQPCQINSAAVKITNEHLQTYTPNITFTYQIAGIQYSADKTHTLATETNLALTQRTINQYPPGRQTLCYVNPNNPKQAVLRRVIALDNLKEFEQFILAILLIPVIPYLLINNIRFRRACNRIQRQASPKSLPDYLNTCFAQNPNLCLAPSSTPSTQILAASFWSCFLGLFLFLTLVQGISDVQSGNPNRAYLILAFLLCVGFLFSLIYLFRLILSLSHPTVRLRLTPCALHPNDVLQIHWEIPEHHRLKKITLRVKGRCETPFFSPDLDDLFTRNKKFKLIETANPAQFADSSATFTIPKNAEPTSDSIWDNQYWAVELRLKTSFLPAAKLTYSFLILPKPQTDATHASPTNL